MIFSIISGAILARQVTPSEFGIVAIVVVFTGFFNILSDFSIGPAIVRSQNLKHQDIREIFTFSIFLGLFFTLLMQIIAICIANLYANTELTNIARFLSISVFFSTVQAVPKALIQKKLKFSLSAIISLSVQVCAGLLAIVLAFKGYGSSAIVAQILAVSLLTFILYFIHEPIIPSKYISKGLKKIYTFTINQLGFNVVTYFSRNSDNFLIGSFLGPNSLGIYDKAYRLMLLPISNLTHVITPTILPSFSHANLSDVEIEKSYLKLVTVLASIGFPLSVLLYFNSEVVIIILYGSDWLNVIPVFSLLSLSIGFQMVLTSTGVIFQSINRTDLMFQTGIIGGGSLIISALIGVFYFQDLFHVGLLVFFSYILYFLSNIYFLHILGLKSKEYSFVKVYTLPPLKSLLLFFVFYVLEISLPFSRGIFFIIETAVVIALITVSLLQVAFIKSEFETVWKKLRK